MKNISFNQISTLIIIISLLLVGFLYSINLVEAQTEPSSSQQSNVSEGATGSESGLVKCGVSRDCTICDIFILVRDIFNFALGLLAVLAVVSIVIGGVYILTSAGDSGKAREGYSIITNAVIGLLLVMSSFLLFSFVLVVLGFQSANFSAALDFQDGQIFSVKCDNASTFNARGQGGGGQGTLSGEGGGSGDVGTQNIACLDSKNINEETSAVMRAISYYEVNQGGRSGYFTGNGGRQLPETTVNHPGSTGGSGAYGRYQMLIPTWRGWAARAGVPKAGSDYNISPQYQDAAVARYLQDSNIATCDSFARSGQQNSCSYNGACQWTPIPGCAACSNKSYGQPNSATRSQPNFATLCKKLLEDERTGNCKK